MIQIYVETRTDVVLCWFVIHKESSYSFTQGIAFMILAFLSVVLWFPHLCFKSLEAHTIRSQHFLTPRCTAMLRFFHREPSSMTMWWLACGYKPTLVSFINKVGYSNFLSCILRLAPVPTDELLNCVYLRSWFCGDFICIQTFKVQIGNFVTSATSTRSSRFANHREPP
jgi:hypothetical protein